MSIPKRLVGLLDSGDIALRIAAARVVSELGIRTRSVVQALGRCLKEPHEELRAVALSALARLGAADVAPMVVPLILSPGPLREHAMSVIAAVGPSVTPQLKSLYGQADFHGKRAVATAISRVGGKDGLSFLVKILPSEPFELQKHVTLCLSEALERLPPRDQAPVLSSILRLVRERGMAKLPQVLASGAVLLGHARGALVPRAREALRQLIDKKHPPEVRRHAIISWGRLISENEIRPRDIEFLFGLLRDEDWHNIAQHALYGLQKLSLDSKHLGRLIDLLRESPHFSVHIHVFERLQTCDRPEIARAILPFLSDPRFRVREAAETALRKMPSAIDSLFFLLMKTDDLEVTQRINAILRDFPQETRAKYMGRAVARLFELFEANDPHYKSFLEFAKAVDPEALRKRVYEAAAALKRSRRSDRWERIAGLVQMLWDNHLITAEGRYFLGVAQLRSAPKDLSPAARRGHLALRVLRSLVYDDPEGLAARLKSDKDLTAEDYHFLGFHFAEEGDEFRPFARAMLEHVVKKFPRSSAAAAAAHKLELQAAPKAPLPGPEKAPAAAKAAAGSESKREAAPSAASALAAARRKAKRPERREARRKPAKRRRGKGS